jgi:hypothetical protein
LRDLARKFQDKIEACGFVSQKYRKVVLLGNKTVKLGKNLKEKFL